jgi:hypothetical protein
MTTMPSPVDLRLEAARGRIGGRHMTLPSKLSAPMSPYEQDSTFEENKIFKIY